jgi:hypothetical protein
LLKELEDEDDEEDDILAELKKIQDIDSDAIEKEVKNRKQQRHPSRSDMNNLGISPKAAKFKNKTAKFLAEQRKGSMLDVSNNLIPTGKPGGAKPRKSLNSANNRYEKTSNTF